MLFNKGDVIAPYKKRKYNSADFYLVLMEDKRYHHAKYRLMGLHNNYNPTTMFIQDTRIIDAGYRKIGEYSLKVNIEKELGKPNE